MRDVICRAVMIVDSDKCVVGDKCMVVARPGQCRRPILKVASDILLCVDDVCDGVLITP